MSNRSVEKNRTSAGPILFASEAIRTAGRPEIAVQSEDIPNLVRLDSVGLAGGSRILPESLLATTPADGSKSRNAHYLAEGSQS